MFKKVLLAIVGLALIGAGLLLAVRQKPVTVVEEGRRTRFADMAPEVLDIYAERDAQHFKRIVGQTARLESALGATKLFDKGPTDGLTADERVEALSLFESTLDHSVELDKIARFHLSFFDISVMDDPARHARHFVLFFAAYVEKLALGLALIDRTINKPQFEELFDEGSQGLGIQPGAYATLKWNVVHVEDAATALAAHQWMKLLSGQLDTLAKTDPWGFVINRLDDRYDIVKTNLTSKSVKLFGGNTVDIGKDTAHMVWFPAQAKVAEEMGDARVHRVDEPLITEAQAKEVVSKSEPGDVLVERHNWYLSNIALPGFWPHAALWLGSQAELAAAFDTDETVTKSYGKPLTAYLEEKYGKAWTDYTTPDKKGDPPRVIEAVSEGVVFSSSEHSIGESDYVGAMRPKVSKLDKARAIERAFSYAGRPYDFDFDFFTDESLVCSELVYKAYEPRKECTGVKLPLEKVVGRMTLGPNSIVRVFDDQLGGKAEQLQFAWFLDGHEAARNATFEGVEAFRKSHLRPKWDVAQK